MMKEISKSRITNIYIMVQMLNESNGKITDSKVIDKFIERAMIYAKKRW